MSVKRILVTGGAGFIGSHTIDLLLQQGHQIVVLDNLFSGKLSNLNLSDPNIEFIEGDVLEYPLIQDLLSNCDAVLHLAAIASVPYTIEHPIYSLQVNTQGFLHILEAVRKLEKPIRVVYASSAAVYGESPALPCDDTKPLLGDALSPYALQKIHCEHYAALYERLYGIKSLGLRYFNVYGPRQDANSPYSGVISRLVDAYKNHAPFTLFGGGEQSRDFIQVSDVAAANVLALEKEVRGVVNIATGQPQTLLQMIDIVDNVDNEKVTVNREPARPGDILASYASILHAEETLGFHYTISLKEGLTKMVGKE